MHKENEDHTENSENAVNSGEPETAVEETAAGMDSSPVSAGEFSDLMQKLDEVSQEVNTHKERYLRTVADLENYRKRAVRDKEEARRQAICNLLEDIVPVLDHFKLGLKSAESHEGGNVFAEGFKMILSQMESALKQNGLEEINPDGDLFDPNFHESIAHVPSDSVVEGHVVEVHRIGYKIRERLLRPAQVVVSSGRPDESANGEETSPTED